jgi:hypothetical protein
LWKCLHAETKEALDETLDGWRALTAPFWRTHHFPDEAERNFADPALAWCRTNGCADAQSIATVETAVRYLLGMARCRPCGQPTIYANKDEAREHWSKFGDLLIQARAAWQALRRLAALSWEPWERSTSSEHEEQQTMHRSSEHDGPDLDAAEAEAQRQQETLAKIQQIQHRLDERRQRVVAAMDVLDGLLPAPTASDKGVSLSEVEPVLDALMALCQIARECGFKTGIDDILERDGPDAGVTDRTAIHLYRLASANQPDRCRELLVRIASWPVRAEGDDKRALGQSGVWAGVRLFFDVIVPNRAAGGIPFWHPDYREMQRLRSELAEVHEPPGVDRQPTTMVCPLVAERVGRRHASRELAHDPDWDRQVRYCQGFDPDWWIPALDAERWKTRWYPLHRTVESVRAWVAFTDQMRMAYLGPLASPENATKLKDDRGSDLRLIRELAPELYEAAMAGHDPRYGPARGQAPAATSEPANHPERSVDEKNALLKAPVGIPDPLTGIYHKVADAVFVAGGNRRRMATDRFYPDGIRGSALALLNALRAAHCQVNQSEIWLRARAPEVWDACQAALDAVTPVHHALAWLGDNVADYLLVGGRACPVFEGCSADPGPRDSEDFERSVRAYFARVPELDEWGILDAVRAKTIAAADRCNSLTPPGVPGDPVGLASWVGSELTAPQEQVAQTPVVGAKADPPSPVNWRRVGTLKELWGPLFGDGNYVKLGRAVRKSPVPWRNEGRTLLVDEAAFLRWLDLIKEARRDARGRLSESELDAAATAFVQEVEARKREEAEKKARTGEA